MEKKFKLLITLAVATVIATTSSQTVVMAKETIIGVQQKSTVLKVSGLVLEKDNELYSLETSTFLKLKLSKDTFLNGMTPKYITDSDGNYYSASNFVKSKLSNKGDTSAAFNSLLESKGNASIEPVEVSLKDGSPFIEEGINLDVTDIY